jgi:hypothetical protein
LSRRADLKPTKWQRAEWNEGSRIIAAAAQEGMLDILSLSSRVDYPLAVAAPARTLLEQIRSACNGRPPSRGALLYPADCRPSGSLASTDQYCTHRDREAIMEEAIRLQRIAQVASQTFSSHLPGPLLLAKLAGGAFVALGAALCVLAMLKQLLDWPVPLLTPSLCRHPPPRPLLLSLSVLCLPAAGCPRLIGNPSSFLCVQVPG